MYICFDTRKLCRLDRVNIPYQFAWKNIPVRKDTLPGSVYNEKIMPANWDISPSRDGMKGKDLGKTGRNKTFIATESGIFCARIGI